MLSFFLCCLKQRKEDHVASCAKVAANYKEKHPVFVCLAWITHLSARLQQHVFELGSTEKKTEANVYDKEEFLNSTC